MGCSRRRRRRRVSRVFLPRHNNRPAFGGWQRHRVTVWPDLGHVIRRGQSARSRVPSLPPPPRRFPTISRARLDPDIAASNIMWSSRPVWLMSVLSPVSSCRPSRLPPSLSSCTCFLSIFVLSTRYFLSVSRPNFLPWTSSPNNSERIPFCR